MEFDLNETQYGLQENLKQFFNKQCPLTRVREVFERGGALDDELWQSLGSLGLLGILVPDEYDGLGLDLLDVAAAAEILGYSVAPGPFTEHVLATLAITRGGTKQQREHWLADLATGRRRATIALAEGDDSWDPRSWLIDQSEGTITGQKTWVLYPQDVDLIVVGTTHGLVLVDGSAAGISATLVDGIDRTRQLGTVTFDGVACEPLDGGTELAGAVIDAGLNLLAADAFGAAVRILEMTVDYAKTRKQFGVEIGNFQAVKHQIADLAVEVYPAQGLYWYAAHAYDNVPADRSRFAALAKAHIGEIAASIGRRAIELHGGIGYTWEADVHYFLKRALFDRAYLGTPRALRAAVAALNDWPKAS